MGDAPPSMTIPKGGGCFSSVGLMCLVCGLLSGLGVLSNALGDSLGDPFWLVVLSILAVLLLITGAVLTFGRAGITLDPDANAMTSWWRLFGYTHSTVQGLDPFKTVAVVRERVRGLSGGPSFIFHVRLRGDGVETDLKAAGTYDEARTLALAVAETLGLEVVYH